MSTCYIPGTVLGAENTAVNKTIFLHLGSVHWVRYSTHNTQIGTDEAW